MCAIFILEKDVKAYLTISERVKDNPVQVPEGKSNVIFWILIDSNL